MAVPLRPVSPADDLPEYYQSLGDNDITDCFRNFDLGKNFDLFDRQTRDPKTSKRPSVLSILLRSRTHVFWRLLDLRIYTRDGSISGSHTIRKTLFASSRDTMISRRAYWG
jgi:hypothetical protein